MLENYDNLQLFLLIGRTCFFLQLRKPSELEPIEIAYLALGIVSCLTALGMTIDRLVNSKSYVSNDFVFASLLLINICKQLNFS